MSNVYHMIVLKFPHYSKSYYIIMSSKKDTFGVDAITVTYVGRSDVTP
jgi:hypothetical protein